MGIKQIIHNIEESNLILCKKKKPNNLGSFNSSIHNKQILRHKIKVLIHKEF